MNISIEKKKFSEAVHTVGRFAEKKSAALQALTSILILVSDGRIKMRATNLEIGIDLTVPGTIRADGVVAVPAALLQQIASSLLSDGAISLEHTGDTLTVQTNTGRSILKTVPYEDFPSIPFPENPVNSLVVPGATIKHIFSSVASCASSSTVRPELASVYVSLEGGVLTAVATDSFRLVEKKVAVSNKGVQGKILIPAKNTLEIAQSLSDDECTVSFDDHQCAFVSDTSVIVSRLTNATYPDYGQIIPKDSITEAIVLRKDIEMALKRTAIFSDTFQKVRISCDPKKNTVSLFAKNADIGESSETVSARVSGNAVDISFNHRYLSTILTLTTADSISLTVSGIGRPLIMRGIGDTSILYLVSPMNQ